MSFCISCFWYIRQPSLKCLAVNPMFNAKLPSSEGTQHVLWLLLHSKSSHTCGLYPLTQKYLKGQWRKIIEFFDISLPCADFDDTSFFTWNVFPQKIFFSLLPSLTFWITIQDCFDHSCYKFFAIFRKETMGFKKYVSGYWVVGLNLKI